MTTTGKTVRFEVFRSSFRTWNGLLEEAAAFATTLGPERLISIAHSADHSEGVVVVWYWGESDDAESTGPDR